ncbi:MAPEG family protein [Novosphingobium sp. JCM 18896]|uniref:MAPEG family protein n=1 Tax=Novosphingobium sp. JCM 18896 TaxID=2989731 RepID=UPI0022223B18|nr:MAPEG family protein [Novosphingobium sp. JCM 18896]MCW1430659.1 MAPEG family protein [Novosphingobium sp. JCM 18896]
MKLTAELYILSLLTLTTALMWLPYVTTRVLTLGLMKSMAHRDASDPPDNPWVDRARRAHANAIENLAVFAPLVLVAALTGVSTPATILASKTFLGARIVHYVVYAAGVPVVRTIAFMVGIAAIVTIALQILGT